MRLIHVIAITIVSVIGARSVDAATLTWDRNPELDVRGYVIEYGTQSGNHSTTVDVGNALTYALNPPSGQRYYIVVRAYNGNGVGPKSNEVVLDLTTSTTNRPPTLNKPPNQTGVIGSAVTLALSGSDPENAVLSYSATDLPRGLTINSASGAISGTLQFAGTYNVTATVSDGSLSASQMFTWIVTTSTTAASDTTAPTVPFTSPGQNQTVTKNAKLRASAADAGGSGVRSVRYLLDGVALSEEIAAAPYNYTWTLNKVATGSHQLTARAVANAFHSG